MRRRLGGALLLVGGLITALVGLIGCLRVTADVGRPLPIFYVLATVGPLLLIAGGVALRRAAQQASKAADSLS
jgi:hypothetical protein